MHSFTPCSKFTFLTNRSRDKGRIPLFWSAANLVENLVASRPKACRKPVANLLKTGLHSICLARARTSEPAAVRDQKTRNWSKAQTCTNLSKTWLQTWSKTKIFR